MFPGGSVGAGFIRNAEEVVGNELKINPGASNAERQLAPTIGQAYTLPEIDSPRALAQTLDELRTVRDETLADHPPDGVPNSFFASSS